MFHEVHGPQFVSGFWKNWTPTFIVCLIFQNQTSWSEHLTSLECAYNTIPTTVTDMSPFHFTYRYQLPWFQENDGDKGLPLTLFHGKMLPPDLGQASEGLPPRPGTDEGGSWPASTQLDVLHSGLAVNQWSSSSCALSKTGSGLSRYIPIFTLLDSTFPRTAHWFHHPSWLLHPGWSKLAKQTRSKNCWQQRTEAAVGNTWLNGRSWMGGHE